MRPAPSPTHAARLALTVALASLAVGCGGSESDSEITAVPEAGLDDRDASVVDAAVDADLAARDAETTDSALSPDAAPSSDAASQDAAVATIAPSGARSGERALGTAAVSVSLAPGASAVFRVDATSDEHLGAELTFAPADLDLTLTLERWEGTAPRTLATTDGGRGIRTLAAFDAQGPRTFWFVVKAGARSVSNASIVVRRTPFRDGATCASDCAKLLQLPVRNDPRVDGYDHAASTVFRYQFGRRDLVMLTRHLGRTLAARGYAPFVPEDFSQWNGETPGADVGALRHASHQRGKDVDVSLYGLDGQAPWRSYCNAVTTSEGRECVAGSIRNYDGFVNALLLGGYFESGRATMMFLDRELIPATRTGATTAIARGVLPASVATSFTNGVALQHWPNHDNHVHVRMSEAPYGSSALTYEPFEAP